MVQKSKGKQPDINKGFVDYCNAEGAILVDVRTPKEYREGHIPGSKNVPLQQLDLAYAPPYSSAKDPVNMAGFMIDNISKGLKQWHLADAATLPRDGSVTLLDTRTVGEYSRGHIKGFRNIPVDELRERIGEIEAGKPVYVICQSGLRSYIATRILEGYGFEAYNFSGGFRFYDAVMNDRTLIEVAFACGMDK